MYTNNMYTTKQDIGVLLSMITRVYVSVYIFICGTFYIHNLIWYFQCEKLRELVAKMRETLAKKDDTEPEEIKRQTNELQQASLKLFEMAYKKVRKMFNC